MFAVDKIVDNSLIFRISKMVYSFWFIAISWSYLQQPGKPL